MNREKKSSTAQAVGRSGPTCCSIPNEEGFYWATTVRRNSCKRRKFGQVGGLRWIVRVYRKYKGGLVVQSFGHEELNELRDYKDYEGPIGMWEFLDDKSNPSSDDRPNSKGGNMSSEQKPQAGHQPSGVASNALLGGVTLTLQPAIAVGRPVGDVAYMRMPLSLGAMASLEEFIGSAYGKDCVCTEDPKGWLKVSTPNTEAQFREERA